MRSSNLGKHTVLDLARVIKLLPFSYPISFIIFRCVISLLYNYEHLFLFPLSILCLWIHRIIHPMDLQSTVLPAHSSPVAQPLLSFSSPATLPLPGGTFTRQPALPHAGQHLRSPVGLTLGLGLEVAIRSLSCSHEMIYKNYS